MGKYLLFALLWLGVVLHCSGQISPIRLEPFLTGLTNPVYVTSARDGSNRLFIVQQGGIIKVLQPGSNTPTDFLNITSRVLSGGERGLLGLAFHPQYASNRRFFVYYTRQTDGAIQIAEYQTSTANPNVADATEKIIITIPHPNASNHNGGTVLFGPDGYLYAAPGDGGSANDPPNNAQNINVLLGKMIRLDVDNIPDQQQRKYNIPADNPFAGATPGADEIYALGLRNPYRFSFDRGGTNQLWLADVGQNVWEEVDIIINGGNYGWRIYEGNACTNIDGCNFPPNYVPPVFQYSNAGSPRCSITGGYVYRGQGQNLPIGSYVYADYCTGEIFLWHNNEQSLLLDTPRNIAGFGEDEAGEIYVVGYGGTIEKIDRIEVSITGRVTTPDGAGLRNASVFLTAPDGTIRSVLTSSFGFYQFAAVPAGLNYRLVVSSKRYRFSSRNVAVGTNDLSNMDFVGVE
jgi:glucose/arabinose dehydrogenase